MHNDESREVRQSKKSNALASFNDSNDEINLLDYRI